MLQPVVKKPNPQNEKNKATLEELEAEIKLCVQDPAGLQKALILTWRQTRRRKGRMGNHSLIVENYASTSRAFNTHINTSPI